MIQTMSHTSVLLHESIEGLNLSKGEVFLDATIGSGGHAREVCERYGGEVRVIGIDADPHRVAEARSVLASYGCSAEIYEGNFRNLDTILTCAGISSIDAILFDLGFNSQQLESSERGFSFLRDEPLFMTYADPKPGILTARDIVNSYDEEEIARILFEYGEERYSRRIARAIVEERKSRNIGTTKELVSILAKVLPTRYQHIRIHFATRTFQALRIAVNDEINALVDGLRKGFSALSGGGRCAVISFHSLEDRVVKKYFRECKNLSEAILVTKKPIIPSENEQKNNPRSRSAKLRILEKL